MPAPSAIPASPPAKPPRVASLDALRGFDMFWILGMEQFAESLAKANPSPWAQFIGRQLDHAPWEGFHFLDLIFPLFVFISGASLVFSLSALIERRGRAAAMRRLAIRSVVLYAIGLLYYGGISGGVETIRWVGVLQRIAICGLCAGTLFCCCGRKTRLIICAALLLAYWAWMSFVPLPGGGPTGLAAGFAEGPTSNWANWFDFHYLPGRKWDTTHDPEGVLSTIPAIATCLLGVFAGELLRNTRVAPSRKAATLIVAGIALAAAGWLWGMEFPVIKKLWTSSYVLVAGGYSAALLGAFYWIIDVRGVRAWSKPFVWIGMNAITLYLIHHFVPMDKIAATLLGGPVGAAVEPYSGVLNAAGVIAICILIAWFLHRRAIFLRV